MRIKAIVLRKPQSFLGTKQIKSWIHRIDWVAGEIVDDIRQTFKVFMFYNVVWNIHVCTIEAPWLIWKEPGYKEHLIWNVIFQTIFSMHFTEWKSRILIKISLTFVPKGPIDKNSINLDYSLGPNRRQAMIWTNADQIDACIYVALGGNEHDELTTLGWDILT